MTCAVFDFPAIAKHARLKALDGTPQNVVAGPVVSAPVEFDGYGMYAGWVDAAATEVIGVNDSCMRAAETFAMWVDTAPSEYCPPEQDPA